MPLAFPSRTHGTIVFGFFNIEIDMLLLERFFFFGDHFCHAVVELAEAVSQDVGSDGCAIEALARLPGFEIRDRAAIGNVNAAIRGWDLSGFIGETYEKFPFPTDPTGFKQKPYGARNQPWTEVTIRQYGEPLSIMLRWEVSDQCVAIGEIAFTPAEFAALIGYVDRGGQPRWENDERPPHVRSMIEVLRRSSSPLVAGLI